MTATATLTRSNLSPSTVGQRVLGGYRILKVLGRGTFATAYLATDEKRGRRAVVKATHAHLLEGTQADIVRRRYAAEVRALASVEHASLVEIYDAGESDTGIPMIAMQYVRGMTLDAKLRALGEPLPLPLLLSMGRQILSALAAVHAAGIVHHDVSPPNIMWDAQAIGGVKVTLLDFGVASFVTEPHEPGAKGTLPYMAPEQLRGAGTTASDIYSLGTVLWWAATGYGYVDDGRSAGRRAAEHNPTLPPALIEILDRLLDPDPETRPTAAELVASWPDVATIRVALVDDNPVTSSLVHALLDESGCAVTVHDDPLAIARQGSERFDLVVISATLHGVDVPRVVAYLEHAWEDLPIVTTDPRTNASAAPTHGTTLRIPGELHRLAEHIEALRDARASSPPRRPPRTPRAQRANKPAHPRRNAPA